MADNKYTLRVLSIIEDTTVDGPGFRTCIYCAGCTHACEGCHNPPAYTVLGALTRAKAAIIRNRGTGVAAKK